MSEPVKPSDNDTLTFKDDMMTLMEVTDLFGKYGTVKYVSVYLNRFFIQFESPGEAAKAHSALRRNCRVAYAHARTRPRPRKNFRQKGERIRFGNPEDLPERGYTAEEYNNRFDETWQSPISITRNIVRDSVDESAGPSKENKENNTDNADEEDADSEKQFILSLGRICCNSPVRPDPEMEEQKDEARNANLENEEYENRGAPPEYNVVDNIGNTVVMANIPKKYNLNDVYDLIEEIDPVAFTEIDYSLRMKIKFCQIFLRSQEDVNYLKQKLNGFIICGKQLTVVEPAELSDENRWKA